MVGKNKYVKHAHISERKFRLLIKLFAEDLNATQISHLTGISRPAINKYLHAIRKRIMTYCESDSPLKGEIEVDESYFCKCGFPSVMEQGESKVNEVVELMVKRLYLVL